MMAVRAIAVLAIAGLARLAHGPGSLGYDALWSLRWGHEILHLDAPAFASAGDAPTPHPLANLVSTALMALGPDPATTILLVVTWLALGLVAVSLARLGAELFSWPVGIVAAAALVTRGLIVEETAQAFVDLPFLVFAVAALEREVRRPREGPQVAILLVLAGLLRPEGWALEALYLLYRWPDLAGGGRVRLGAVLAFAPVLWLLMDLWATGDPLHSLHGTQSLAAELDRPRGSGTAITLAPAALRNTIQSPLLWVALAGALGALLDRERASRIPGVILVLGLAGYFVLGVAGLPLLDRYLLLPALMLMLFAGLAVFGFTTEGPHRRAWMAGGAVAAIVLVAGVPSDVRRLDRAKDFGAGRQRVQDALRTAVRATADERCARGVAPDRRSQATIYAQRLGEESGPAGSLYFNYANVDDASIYALGPIRERALRRARVVYRSREWIVTARGCPAT